MNLTTTYMGFTLPHPLVPGASPLTGNLDTARRLVDAGAPMLVLPSLFEEQIVREELAITSSTDLARDVSAESISFFPEADTFALGPHDYLEYIRKLKAAVPVPLVASLNGTTPGGWIRYAQLIQQAGADALELNLYELAADPDESADALEQRSLDLVHQVRQTVRIPLAVKLSPFYSSLPNFARRLDQLGVNALVLFNRFYQPDFDLEELQILHRLYLSTPSELLLRLRWLAILSGRINASLACTGGVHSAHDALKAVMAGAHAVQIVSALLQRGPDYLRTLITDLTRWLQDHEYQSLQQAHASMSLIRCPDPKAYERANYAQILQSWTRS